MARRGGVVASSPGSEGGKFPGGESSDRSTRGLTRSKTRARRRHGRVRDVHQPAPRGDGDVERRRIGRSEAVRDAGEGECPASRGRVRFGPRKRTHESAARNQGDVG